MKHLYLLPLGIALSGTAFAELGEPGLGGEVSLLAGFSGGKSNFNMDKETKTGELNSAGESDSGAMFAPLGQLRYTFGDTNNHQLYFGTARGDIIEGVFAIELGYAMEFGNESVLSFAYLPTIANGEVWEDPYLTNTARKKTDISGNTYRIQYENILDTGLSGDFAFYDQDIDNEKSGSQLTSNQELLNRDANGCYAGISMGFPISATSFLEPSISYQDHSADGKAMSFKRYGISLTYMHMVGNHAFSVNGDYSNTQYDAKNPVFNDTQKDNSYGVNLSYEYSEFMGWDNWGFNALLGYSNTASNINFYDTNDYFTGVGLSYKF